MAELYFWLDTYATWHFSEKRGTRVHKWWFKRTKPPIIFYRIIYPSSQLYHRTFKSAHGTSNSSLIYPTWLCVIITLKTGVWPIKTFPELMSILSEHKLEFQKDLNYSPTGEHLSVPENQIYGGTHLKVWRYLTTAGLTLSRQAISQKIRLMSEMRG